MDSKIQIFKNEKFGEIRTMTMPDGQVGFVGKDVASILGYKNPSNALSVHVDKEDKTAYPIQVSGSNYVTNTCFINESGLYALILSSKLPQAREFKRWVTAEVLPQIRKTGGYIPMDEPSDKEKGKGKNEKSISDDEILSRALLIAQRTIELKNSQLEEQKPLVQFAEAITASDSSILIGDLAKLITRRGHEIGRTRLFNWMRSQGYLFQHENRPIQKYVEQGLFELNAVLIETNHGAKESFTTKVTAKGQQYFLQKFKV